MTYVADASFFRFANNIAEIFDANRPPCPLVVDQVVRTLVGSGLYPLSIRADVLAAYAGSSQSPASPTFSQMGIRHIKRS